MTILSYLISLLFVLCHSAMTYFGLFCLVLCLLVVSLFLLSYHAGQHDLKKYRSCWSYPSKFDLKFDSNYHRFWIPGLIFFDLDLDAFLDPFCHPNRPKFRPRCLFKLYLLQKRDFHENLQNPMKFDELSAQDGSENDPKLAQDHSKTVPKAIIFHVEFLLQF